MSPIPSTLLLAARSGEVRGSYLAVFVELHEWLDADQFRPVRAWCVADRLKLSRRHVYNALVALERSGFILHGPTDGRTATFKLAA